MRRPPIRAPNTGGRRPDRGSRHRLLRPRRAVASPVKSRRVRRAHPGEYLQAGRRLGENGNVIDAEKSFRATLDNNPKADYAWTNIGMLKEARRPTTRDAEKAYRNALEIKPDEDGAMGPDGALVLPPPGAAGRSSRSCRQKISELPAALGLRNALVYVLMAEGKSEAAANEAKKVLKADEHNIRRCSCSRRSTSRNRRSSWRRWCSRTRARSTPTMRRPTTRSAWSPAAEAAAPGARYRFAPRLRCAPTSPRPTSQLGSLLNEAQDYDSA